VIALKIAGEPSETGSEVNWKAILALIVSALVELEALTSGKIARERAYPVAKSGSVVPAGKFSIEVLYISVP
jgi:hypothetical protein